MSSSFEEAFSKAGLKPAIKKLDEITKRVIVEAEIHAAAMERLFEETQDDPVLLRTLVGEDAIRFALRKQIARHDRKAPWRKSVKVKTHRRQKPGEVTPRRTPEPTAEIMAAGRTARRNSIMETFMVNGQPLGKITAAEARRAAVNMAGKSTFLHRMAHGLTDDMRIEEGWTPDEAEKLYNECVKEAA